MSREDLLTVKEFLNDKEFALGLSPGFFCFYAHIGVLHALDELGILMPTHISGSSAGNKYIYISHHF
jgi:predicted acylesterase/phospholipase RssA